MSDTLELEVGKAILSAYEDGFLHAQFDANGDDPAAAQAEVLSPFGLDGRPRDPEADADGVPGVGATAIRAIEGRGQHMLVMGDPRATEALPALEKGSSRLYAHLDGNKVTWLRLDGATGSAKLRVSVGNSESTVEVNGSTGDISLTHQGGTVLVVKTASVELGAASGGGPLMKYTEFAAAWATLTTNAAALGLTVPALTGVATTKVNGT